MNRRLATWLIPIGIVAGAGIVAAVMFRRRSMVRLSSLTHPYVNDPVDLYVEESFPASDAPGYAPTTRIGRVR